MYATPIALIKSTGLAPALQEVPKVPVSSQMATLRIAYVGLCRTDLRVARGDLIRRDSLVLGHECSGYVVHDPSGRFSVGDAVALNPLLPTGEFLGLDCDGVLQTFVQILPAQLVCAKAVPMKAAAYVEPVAASMAVLNARILKNEKGIIYYANRISQLTYLVLQSLGYDITWKPYPPDNSEANVYDYAIETVFDTEGITNMLQALKPGGVLVVKSRQYSPCSIVPGLLVTKELTLQAVNYFHFEDAMTWIREHSETLTPLLGPSFKLADWQAAFALAEAEDTQKIFIEL